MAIRPNGAYTLVANLNSDNVSVINTTTHQVVATVPVGIRACRYVITNWRYVTSARTTAPSASSTPPPTR